MEQINGNLICNSKNLYICEVVSCYIELTISFLKPKHYVLDIRISIQVRRCPWPATKEELIDYAIRSGAPLEVIENLQEPGG